MKISKTVEEYISTFPQAIQKRLQSIRKIIQGAAPDAKESISYRIPY
jgi:uncharacterized protein YdhG (YjbR/CyaY superfamily)